MSPRNRFPVTGEMVKDELVALGRAFVLDIRPRDGRSR